MKRSGEIRRSTRFDYVEERRRKWNKTLERERMKENEIKGERKRDIISSSV